MSSSRWTTSRSRYMKSATVTSSVTSVWKPWRRWRVIPRKKSALSRSVFDGIVPQFTRAPPTTGARSTRATRFCALAAWMAARSPPGPPPRTTTSKSEELGGGVTRGS